MGQLDEAIREHLELKRRRGADTSEVTRQEQEAFGPPRHADFEVAPVAVATHDHLELDHGDREPPAHVEEAPAAALRAVEDAPLPQSEPLGPHGDPAEDLPETPEAEPAPAPAEPEPVAEVAQATREFDADEVRAASAPPAAPTPVPAPAPPASEPEGEDAEDVLEETPEFLQETPEHDRLWFEQRPPRDFDF